jgi:IclR family transcriptional regulator, acetate operon repressor
MNANSSSGGKLLRVMEAIAAGNGGSLRDAAHRSNLPFSTVHRIAGELLESGFIVRNGRGEYWIGPSTIRLGNGGSLRALMSQIARPELHLLAKACRTHVHLGLFEEDMVTYLIKEHYGRDPLITVEGMQLEAYCSAIGKVLLAHLPIGEQARYLSQGEFVPLTARTIVDPAILSDALIAIRGQGYAMDLEEVTIGLQCIAVPVFDPEGAACAAISASGVSRKLDEPALLEMLPLLQATARQISVKLFGRNKFPDMLPE